MRKTALLLALVATAALAGINIETDGASNTSGRRVEMTDCNAVGGDAGTANYGLLNEGNYLMRVTGEDVFLCFAVDGGQICASGGEKFPSNTVACMTAPRGGWTLSCRSSGATADVVFTKASGC